MVSALFFVADYHALTTIKEPDLLQPYIHEVAATWIAMGLDPERVVFYRQSDVPEIFEMAWILACVSPKGWMNKGHAFKSLALDNQAKGARDVDAGINMGLYSYPVLMAADILSFDAHEVLVGKDQLQHIEITRDLEQRIVPPGNRNAGATKLAVLGTISRRFIASGKVDLGIAVLAAKMVPGACTGLLPTSCFDRSATDLYLQPWKRWETVCQYN